MPARQRRGIPAGPVAALERREVPRRDPPITLQDFARLLIKVTRRWPGTGGLGAGAGQFPVEARFARGSCFGKTIIGPPEPRSSTVRARRLADYAHVTAAHLAVAKRLSSPMLLGPPICDELVALIEHTFTEEEAEVVRRLKTFSGRTAEQVARAARRPVDEVEPILDRLAFGKRTIAADGPADARRYRLMPIIPGIYEMVLIGESPEKLSQWHRRFAELVEALLDTGYLLEYQDRQLPMVRFLPVGRAVGTHPAALPSDKLQPVLDRFDTFAVGNCQCRISGHVKGQPCGKPLLVCTAMGKWAEMAIEGGYMRRISKQNLLDIKREAESHGLVTWIMNVRSTGSQALRVLLQGDAGGQRVQRPGDDGPAALHAPVRSGLLHLLRPVRRELSHGRDHRGY